MLAVFISESNHKVELRITDNGKGLPKGFPDNFETNSLGLLLIETLSSQLNADYSYETKNGETHFTLTFEKKEIKGSSSALMQ
jgi:two-component sensor histidine kinase